METTLALIQYYAREKYWHHIIDACQEELRRDPILLFWKAFGVFNEGNPTEAIRDLGTISQRREAAYAACIAQIYYHKNCKLVDSEAVSFLQAQKTTLQSSAPDSSLLLTAQFFSLVGKHDKARKKVSEVLERNQVNFQAISVYAWCELADPNGDYSAADRLLEQVIDESGDLLLIAVVQPFGLEVSEAGGGKVHGGDHVVCGLGGPALVIECGAAGGVVFTQGQPGIARDIPRLFSGLGDAAPGQVVHVGVVQSGAFDDFLQRQCQ